MGGFGSPSQTTTANPISVQGSTQGGAGAGSVTSSNTVGTVQGNSVINDPALQLATVQALAQEVTAALTGGAGVLSQNNQTLGQLAATAQSQAASQTADYGNILSAALQSEANLATAQGTGGASLTYGTNESLIWGVIALAGAALAFVFFRKGAK